MAAVAFGIAGVVVGAIIGFFFGISVKSLCP